MGEHVKIGNGFKIIYGGRGKIRWIFDKHLAQPESLPNLLLPAQHPASLILEGLNTAAQFLQWWEQRKQNQLSYAQHEERRIPWLVDIMNTFYEEFRAGELRDDTVFFFEREISRLFEKIEENNLIDVPSSLLLQISRTTDLLINVNTLITSEPFNKLPNFSLPGTNVPDGFVYKSCRSLKNDEDVKEYIQLLEQRELNLENLAAFCYSPGLTLAAIAIKWGYDEYQKAKAKDKKRLDSFSALTNLAIELRSTSIILRNARAMPQLVWHISEQELNCGCDGHISSIEELRQISVSCD